MGQDLGSATPQPGSHLGPYLIEELVGRGGMGVVYRAEHPGLQRKVALKLLAPEIARDESFRERFVREARSAAALDHPNVIPIYEAGEHDGVSFIAMRFVDGVDLRGLLIEHGPPQDPRQALEVVAQLGSALDASHQKGLVHRDVKPGNVLMVRGSQHCYLTDFGLTKATSSQTGFTGTGQWLGTTAYVAPEQIEGRPLDHRSDIYSLTCVLFELLTGSVPYRRDSEVAVMYAHMNEPPPRPSELRGDLPPALDEVIARGMAKRPEERYASCADLVEDVGAALEGKSLGATTPSPALAAVAATPPAYPSAAHTSAEPPPPPVTPATAHPVPPAQPPRQRPVMAIALILAALLLAGGASAAALIATRGNDESSGGEQSAGSGSEQSGGGNTGQGQVAGGAEGSAGGEQLESYDSSAFTARVPAGWITVQDAELQSDGRIVSKFRDPDRPRSILIDMNDEPFTGSVLESAQTTERGAREEPGFRALGIYRLQVGGENAAEVRYEVQKEGRLIRQSDIFFGRESRGFAVLGETSPDEFEASLPLFREVANSVRPR